MTLCERSELLIIILTGVGGTYMWLTTVTVGEAGLAGMRREAEGVMVELEPRVRYLCVECM